MPRNILTNEQVDQVRSMFPNYSDTFIANKFGVSKETIKSIRLGRRHKKENNLLTQEQVKQIKELLTTKRSLKEIAELFGVNSSTISRIKLGQTWKVTGQPEVIERSDKSIKELNQEQKLRKEVELRLHLLKVASTKKAKRLQHKLEVEEYKKQIREAQIKAGLREKEVYEMNEEEVREYRLKKRLQKKVEKYKKIEQENALIRIAQYEFVHNKIVTNKDMSDTTKKTRVEWLELSGRNKLKTLYSGGVNEGKNR